MSKYSRINFFKDMFNLYSVEILGTIIPIIKDNREAAHIITEFDEETGKVVVKYNARRLGHWSHALIICGVFHEIRHIIQGIVPYDTEEEQVHAELDAELYALQKIKQLYPKYYKENCDYVKRKLSQARWKKQYPIHYKAFKQIPDYQ